MKLNYKILFLAILINLPLWWGINVFAYKMGDFFSQKTLLQANTNNTNLTLNTFKENTFEKFFPLKIEDSPNPGITAKAVISFSLKDNGETKILFEQNSKQKLPIASLTKIMTATMALEHKNALDILEINPESAEIDNKYGKGKLKVSEKLFLQDILRLLLIESNNGAAHVIAAPQEKEFIDAMNLKAVSLGLEDTFFMNPSGLDPDDIKETHNYSTASDLAHLSAYILKKHPLIWEIGKNKEYDIYLSDGTFYQQLKSTNELLDDFPELSGKTGWTPLARGALIVVYRSPSDNGYLVNVVLGSENRFEDMRNLIYWIEDSYIW